MSTDTLPADAPTWAQVLFAKLDRIERAQAAAPGAALDPMITAHAADRRYRLADGAARKAWDQGLVKGQLRRGRSPTGQVLYLDKADCDRQWLT